MKQIIIKGLIHTTHVVLGLFLIYLFSKNLDFGIWKSTVDFSCEVINEASFAKKDQTAFLIEEMYKQVFFYPGERQRTALDKVLIIDSILTASNALGPACTPILLKKQYDEFVKNRLDAWPDYHFEWSRDSIKWCKWLDIDLSQPENEAFTIAYKAHLNFLGHNFIEHALSHSFGISCSVFWETIKVQHQVINPHKGQLVKSRLWYSPFKYFLGKSRIWINDEEIPFPFCHITSSYSIRCTQSPLQPIYIRMEYEDPVTEAMISQVDTFYLNVAE
jgi:hypothetical protein